jgi:Tripartite tricarboxylate transporter TctB family
MAEGLSTMDTIKQLTTRTRVEGLVIMLVAAGYLWETTNVPEFYQLPDAPGPTTFPYLLGAIFALVGLWLLISPNELIARFKDAAAAPAPASAPPSDGWLTRLFAGWHFYSMWAVILLYLWLMPILGFPLATFLLLAPFVYLLGETRWHIVLAYSLIATIVIYAGFKFGLNVRLPLGILEVLFK